MGEQLEWTPRARRVLTDADREAEGLGHPYIGTEHLLLAIGDATEGVAVAALEALKVDTRALRSRVEEIVQRGKPEEALVATRPYTTRSQRALALAREAAVELAHSYLGTEHLLLGLTAERTGIAAQLLGEQGVSHERARDEVVRLLRPLEARENRGTSPEGAA